MPQRKAAFKALKVSEKRRIGNQHIINEIKTLTKKINETLATKDTEIAKKLLPTLIKKINKAKSKGVIHKTAASRKISRIMKKAATFK